MDGIKAIYGEYPKYNKIYAIGRSNIGIIHTPIENPLIFPVA